MKWGASATRDAARAPQSRCGRPGWVGGGGGGHDGAVIGAIILAVILILVFPVVVALSGAAAAGILGHFLSKEGEAANEGSELIGLNK